MRLLLSNRRNMLTGKVKREQPHHRGCRIEAWRHGALEERANKTLGERVGSGAASSHNATIMTTVVAMLRSEFGALRRAVNQAGRVAQASPKHVACQQCALTGRDEAAAWWKRPKTRPCPCNRRTAQTGEVEHDQTHHKRSLR